VPPAASAEPDGVRQRPALAICEPGELETCVCSDASTGARRCNAGGTDFGPCDACPDGSSTCGARRCSPIRLAPIGLTLPACCPGERADRCGIDVGFVANNHGLSLSCLELEAPGQLDASCPSVEVPHPEGGLLTFAGCRTPRGRCGYDVDVPDVIHLGCVDVRR
jgi:hypothetical protein